MPKAVLLKVGLYRHFAPLVQATAPQPEMKQVGNARFGSTKDLRQPTPATSEVGAKGDLIQ